MKTPEDILAHFGVKGMKWGVRRGGSSIPPVSTVSSDAQRVSDLRNRIKTRGGTKALTNQELQDVITRMNLEQQFSRLNPSATKKGLKIVSDILQVGNTVNQAVAFVNSPAGKAIRDGLSKRG